MSQPYRHHHRVSYLLPSHALARLGKRPIKEATGAIRPVRHLRVLLVRLVWLLRGLAQLLAFLNLYGMPAARSDHR